MNKTSKTLSRLSLLLLLAILSNTGTAQNYQLIGPMQNDIQHAFPNAAPTWMNNAVFNNSNGTAYAVAWDEGGGAVYFEVMDNLGQTTGTITCAGAGGTQSHPDVILGGDNNNTYLGIVYTNTNGGVSRIYMEVYTITNVGTTNPLGTSTCTNYIFQLTNTQQSQDPHIDIANEITGMGAFVTADKFVVAWEEIGCSMILNPNTIGARACASSLITLATCASGPGFTYSGCLNITAGLQRSGGQQVDIAMYKANNQYIAQFVFADANAPSWGNLYIGKWNLTIPTLTPGIVMDNPGIGNIEYPRIDVVDQTVSGGNIDKEIVYRYFNGATWDVMSVNQAFGGPPFDNASAYYNIGTGASDNSKPVVTSGTLGSVATSSIAYANSGDNNVWLNSVNWANGQLTEIANSGDKDYYQVNLNTGEAADDPVAISNDYIYTSAMIADEIFVCWYNTNSTTIDCKATSAFVPAFKPTGAQQVLRSAQGLKVYPVPAADKLYISRGSKEPRSYTITDAIGRLIMQGSISNDTEELDITALANGLYLLNISNADNSVDGLKIVKE